MSEPSRTQVKTGPDNAMWRSALAKSPLFAGFDDAYMALLLECGRETSMRRGDTLMRAGDPGTSMMAVLAGEVRVVLPGVAGRDQTVKTLGAGAAFGEIALFDGKPRTADIVAATNGKLLVIERVAVQRLMARDPQFGVRVIEMLCARLRDTLVQLDAMVFQDVAGRLATSLLSLAQGRAPRHLDMTQAALGQLVGASREIVNKRLRGWEQAGILALSPGRIVLLDETRLSQMLPGAGAANAG
jgi:CRP-like cAMP-binding protein